MNPTIVERMRNQPISFGKKVRIPKREFYRREKRVNYARNMALFAKAAQETGTDMKKFANFERRKQHKVRYDTWRRQEMPTGEDVRLENLHYANFLGDKYGDNGAKYNTKYPVNVRFCDSMVELDEQSAYGELDSFGERSYRNEDYDDVESEISLGSLDSSNDDEEYNKSVAQLVSRYKKAYEMEWTELPVAEDEYNRYEEEDKFDQMVAYMRTQIQIAETIAMAKGLISGKRKAEGFEDSLLKRARCDDEANNV